MTRDYRNTKRYQLNSISENGRQYGSPQSQAQLEATYE